MMSLNHSINKNDFGQLIATSLGEKTIYRWSEGSKEIIRGCERLEDCFCFKIHAALICLLRCSGTEPNEDSAGRTIEKKNFGSFLWRQFFYQDGTAVVNQDTICQQLKREYTCEFTEIPPVKFDSDNAVHWLQLRNSYRHLFAGESAAECPHCLCPLLLSLTAVFAYSDSDIIW